jgi:hypothetical protein
MERVERVFLALEPIAGELHDGGLAEPIPGKNIPMGEQWRRFRAHVSEDNSAELLDFVGL